MINELNNKNYPTLQYSKQNIYILASFNEIIREKIITKNNDLTYNDHNNVRLPIISKKKIKSQLLSTASIIKSQKGK